MNTLQAQQHNKKNLLDKLTHIAKHLETTEDPQFLEDTLKFINKHVDKYEVS